MKKYIRASISESTPDWLRKRLTYRYGLNNLKPNLLKLGVSLDTANFTYEYPNDSTNVLTAYLIKDDYGTTVYIPKVNDDDAITLNGRNRKLGSIAKSKLPELATDIVYLDLDDPGNVHDKRDRYVDPRYVKDKYATHSRYGGQKYDDYSNSWRSYKNRDKSGYALRSPDQMIADYYEKFPERITSKVDALYDRITQVKSDLMSADFNKPYGRGQYDSGVRKAFHYFSYVVEEYQKLLGTIDESGGLRDNYFETEYREFSKSIRRINEYLDDIEKELDYDATGYYNKTNW